MVINWQKIVAVVGGLVVLAGVAYLVLWLKPESKSDVPMAGVQNGASTVVEEIAGWKKYENKVTGLSFSYPNDWVLSVNGNDSVPNIPFSPTLIKLSDGSSSEINIDFVCTYKGQRGYEVRSIVGYPADDFFFGVMATTTVFQLSGSKMGYIVGGPFAPTYESGSTVKSIG